VINKILQQGENGKDLKKEKLASFTPSSKEPTHFPPNKAIYIQQLKTELSNLSVEAGK